MSDNWSHDLRKIQRSLSKFPFSPFLALGSILYGLGVRVRVGMYKLGLLRQRQLPGFVLSVGNITVGGTGKTPMVIMLAQWAREQGHRVCVLSRGYGGAYKGDVVEVSDGERIKVSWQECGDEPYMIARRLKGVPVIVAKKRYLGGIYASERFGSNFFILDDGFQHLGLKRDFDLVLLDARSPFGNGHLLPRGILREPPSAVKRAHCMVFTRFRNSPDLDIQVENIQRNFPQTPSFKSSHTPERVMLGGTYIAPDELRGKRIAAFAGTASPGSFKETLVSLGAELVFFKGFSDHHGYRQDEIQAIIDEARELRADLVLTTEKDWVKLHGISTEGVEVGYVGIRIELLNISKGFFRLIESSIVSKNA